MQDEAKIGGEQMTKIKTGYGLMLKKTREILTFYTQSNNEGEDCYSEQYILTTGHYPPWIVDDILTAAYVKKFSTEWFNAGYETPTHNYKEEELEVVEIEMTMYLKIQPKIPTPEEFIHAKYGDTKSKNYDPNRESFLIKFLLKEHPEHNNAKYTLWDLKSFYNESKRV
jgi:hypothetical protein